MKASELTLLILQINAAIDGGNCTSISIADVHRAIERRALLKYLKEACGKNIDLSLHLTGGISGFESAYEDAIGRIYDAYAGDERRKWGVQNQGLCLALAWTNEIIQQSVGDVAIRV